MAKSLGPRSVSALTTSNMAAGPQRRAHLGPASQPGGQLRLQRVAAGGQLGGAAAHQGGQRRQPHPIAAVRLRDRGQQLLPGQGLGCAEDAGGAGEHRGHRRAAQRITDQIALIGGAHQDSNVAGLQRIPMPLAPAELRLAVRAATMSSATSAAMRARTACDTLGIAVPAPAAARVR